MSVKTFTRFEYEGIVYLQTGMLQLLKYGMIDKENLFSEPAVLNKTTKAFVDKNQITFGDHQITGMPTFIFDTEEKLRAFEAEFNPVYKTEDEY